MAQRNIYGKPLTRAGNIDKRHSRHSRAENGGQPYMQYFLRHKPNDGRPYHVMAHEVDTGEETIVSRHRLQAKAEIAMEKLRIKQPDRKASPKLRHKLGV